MEALNGVLELVPHVRLDPNDFRTGKKRSQRNIPKREQGKYWAESFKEAGIEGLNPLEANFWVAAVRDIKDERILHEIISKSWQAIPKNAETWQALVQKIDGGLSLLHEGKIIFSAHCCSDLGNLEQWQQAAKNRESTWQWLWNGHPWLYSRYENNTIILSDYLESEPKSLAAGKYAIPSKLFKAAVTVAEADLAAFGERLFALWLSERKGN